MRWENLFFFYNRLFLPHWPLNTQKKHQEWNNITHWPSSSCKFADITHFVFQKTLGVPLSLSLSLCQSLSPVWCAALANWGWIMIISSSGGGGLTKSKQKPWLKIKFLKGAKKKTRIFKHQLLLFIFFSSAIIESRGLHLINNSLLILTCIWCFLLLQELKMTAPSSV